MSFIFAVINYVLLIYWCLPTSLIRFYLIWNVMTLTQYNIMYNVLSCCYYITNVKVTLLLMLSLYLLLLLSKWTFVLNLLMRQSRLYLSNVIINHVFLYLLLTQYFYFCFTVCGHFRWMSLFNLWVELILDFFWLLPEVGCLHCWHKIVIANDD